MTANRSWRKNLLLLTLSLAVSLAVVEAVSRVRYVEPDRDVDPEVAAIQAHLVLHDRLGFTWRPDITVNDDVRITVRDVAFPRLTTDADGFWNHPEAIARRKRGDAIDAVGLGDSFMEHAANTFFEAFDAHGLLYYSMAIHRQAPPQYVDVLEHQALPLEPKWIVLGLFENDFQETEDYDNWERSGMDWFAFHSGTWCGRPQPVYAWERIAHRTLPGITALVEVTRARMRGDRMSVTGPSRASIARVGQEISAARRLTRESGSRLTILLLPSRASVLHGDTAEAQAYDELIPSMTEDERTNVVDLRPLFRNAADPSELYYVEDGHWNENGMRLAADVILSLLTQTDIPSTPSD